MEIDPNIKKRYHAYYYYYQESVAADEERRTKENRPFFCSFQTIVLMQCLTAIQEKLLWDFMGDKEKARIFLWDDM